MKFDMIALLLQSLINKYGRFIRTNERGLKTVHNNIMPIFNSSSHQAVLKLINTEILINKKNV
jgi:hypothetical protein